LLIAADELLIQRLVDFIQDFLIKNRHKFLQQSPVKMVHFIVHNNQFDKIKEAYLEKICENPKLLFDSVELPFLEEDALKVILKCDNLDMKESIIWKKLVKWGIAQHTMLENDMICEDTNNEEINTLEETLRELIKHIRFYQFERQEFIPEVWAYKHLLPDKLTEDVLRCYLDSNAKPLYYTYPIRWGNFKIDSVLMNKQAALALAKLIDKESADGTTSKGSRYHFNLLYRSSLDGLSAQVFHQKCDKKGATIVVAKTLNSGGLIGGYNPLDWNGNNVWKQTTDSFLFKLDCVKSRVSAKISRTSEDTSDYAIYCSKDYGPSFGEGPDLRFIDDHYTLKCKAKSYSKISTL
ncbi:3745_t:CDS:1, partial [Racocetra fulgida]